LVWSLVTHKRRQKLIADADDARSDQSRIYVAIAAVAIYNVIGILDIFSTASAIGSGVGEEANPVLRAAMANLGPGWIAAKLFLQGVISAMVIWFPHRLVIGMFAAAVTFNMIIVVNNFRIVGGF